MPKDKKSYSLQEIRSRNDWPEDARFVLAPPVKVTVRNEPTPAQQTAAMFAAYFGVSAPKSVEAVFGTRKVSIKPDKPADPQD